MRFFLTLLLGAVLLTGGCREAATQEQAAVIPAAAVQPDTLRPQPDSAAAEPFRRLVDYARTEDLHERSTGAIMQALGEQLKGAPYLIGPLDQTDEEVLVCRLDGFDCYTFVDAMLALARGVREQDYSYEAYARHTQDQRYRGGQKNGYCSRLHYFTEWIADNEQRGNVENITQALGGEPLPKDLSFMTEHRARYPRFAENDSLFQCIQQMEESLNDLAIYYIPQDRISAVYDRLRAGDIIATATHIDGLDVTHTGLVYKGADGSTGLLHASTDGGVKVSPDLQRYVQNVDAQIGIVVARPAAK